MVTTTSSCFFKIFTGFLGTTAGSAVFVVDNCVREPLVVQRSELETLAAGLLYDVWGKRWGEAHDNWTLFLV